MKSTIYYCSLIVLFLAAKPTFSQEFKIDPTKFFTDKELQSAHTALRTDYAITEEKNIFLYSNLARMYPQKYLAFYKEYLKTRDYLLKDYQSGNRYYLSLEQELKSAKPMEALYPDKEMYVLAKCWAEESGQKGITGHKRISCKYGYQGENCSYGYGAGLDVVMQLLVDKDVENLGHRKSILNPEFKGMGTAIRFHKRYTNVAVQNFSKTNDELRKFENQKEAAFDELMQTWTAEEQKQADVCRNLNYITDTEKEIYYLVNLMRLFPQRFKAAIWDHWSEYGPELTKEGEVDHKLGYDQVKQRLATASPRTVFIPDEGIVKEARCLSEKWLAKDQGYTNCLTQQYGWRLDTFYPESDFIDRLKILTEPEGGNMLILDKGIIALQEKELFHVKTIIGL